MTTPPPSTSRKASGQQADEPCTECASWRSDHRPRRSPSSLTPWYATSPCAGRPRPRTTHRCNTSEIVDHGLSRVQLVLPLQVHRHDEELRAIWAAGTPGSQMDLSARARAGAGRSAATAQVAVYRAWRGRGHRNRQKQAWDDKVLPPVEQVRPGLWSIPVPIPDNPLRYVLVYALELDGGGVAIVDAGWNTDEAWSALVDGLAAAGGQHRRTSGR